MTFLLRLRANTQVTLKNEKGETPRMLVELARSPATPAGVNEQLDEIATALDEAAWLTDWLSRTGTCRRANDVRRLALIPICLRARVDPSLTRYVHRFIAGRTLHTFRVSHNMTTARTFGQESLAMNW